MKRNGALEHQVEGVHQRRPEGRQETPGKTEEHDFCNRGIILAGSVILILHVRVDLYKRVLLDWWIVFWRRICCV